MRHRQTKGSATDRPHLNHRVTPRLHNVARNPSGESHIPISPRIGSRISQSQASGTIFYGYDGHGKVRLLTDSTGAVTDRYDYDAFGNMISQAGTAPNVYLYSGEQNDPNLSLYNLRARYYNVQTGRFTTADSFEGTRFDPVGLHKYVYGGNNPVTRSILRGHNTP